MNGRVLALYGLMAVVIFATMVIRTGNNKFFALRKKKTMVENFIKH